MFVDSGQFTVVSEEHFGEQVKQGRLPPCVDFSFLKAALACGVRLTLYQLWKSEL